MMVNTISCRILENIVKVLPKTTTANKVVDAVLELVNNLVSPLDDTMDTEEKEAMEEVGIQVVLKEMDVLLEHFNSWIEERFYLKMCIMCKT